MMFKQRQAAQSLVQLQTKSFARQAASQGTLKRSEVPAARYLNRSEWMANQFKDNNTNAYDWQPEVFPTIDPAPRYQHKALGEKPGYATWKAKRAREGVGAVKNALLAIHGKDERQRAGRLWAHFKHIEMRDQVKSMRANEGTLREESVDEAEVLQQVMKEAKQDTMQEVKIEDEFNLPYGFGFDYVIKEKMDLINNKKFQNNRLMDDLVMKLGHMDYRDALAANKYILEAKRHGDYHQ